MSLTTKTSWKNVPMPRGVAALPRTPNGMPVPYISGSPCRHLTVQTAPEMACFAEAANGTTLALYDEYRPPCQPGILGTISIRRQREIMLKGLCQVCGEVNHDEPMWLLESLDTEFLDGTKATKEPPTCTDCMAYAMRVCPMLVGLRSRGVFTLDATRVWESKAVIVDLTTYRRDGVDPLVGGPHSGKAYTYISCIPRDFDRVSSDAFCSLVDMAEAVELLGAGR